MSTPVQATAKPKKSFLEWCKSMRGQQIICTVVFLVLPLLKPAVVTSAILKGVSTYNEYYMANLYLQDKIKYQVVSTSLYVFSGPMGSQYNYICAGVIITIIPALIIFLLCQDQIYSGMAAGAVKE